MASLASTMPVARYHGKLDKSLLDIHFKHVVLELPEASSLQLGSRFKLHLVEHYEEDIFHSIGERVLTVSGSIAETSNQSSMRLVTESCNKTKHGFKSIVPEGEGFSDEVVPVAPKDWPFASPSELCLKSAHKDELPSHLEFALQIPRRSCKYNNTRAFEHECFDLFPTSTEKLSTEIAGIYSSGVPAPFLCEDLLAKL
jgi:hypothetical protein